MVACVWNPNYWDDLHECRNKSPSAQCKLEQLKDIIEDEMITDKGPREDQEQVEDGEEVLDQQNTSSVCNTVFNTLNNEFEHKWLGETVRPLNAHLIWKWTNERIPGHKYSIPGLPWTCVSNGSGKPASGPVSGRRFGSGCYPAKNLNRYVLAGLLPGPTRNPSFFGRVGTVPRVHFVVPTFMGSIKYLSSDRIMTWCIRRLCSLSRSFTSRFQNWDPTDICWVAVK